MGLINNVRNTVAGIIAAKSFDDTKGQWYPVSQLGSTYGHELGDEYENSYGNLTAIAKAGRVVLPYLKDAKGEKYTEEHNVLNVLYKPNADFSDEEFREALILLYLTKPKFYVRVHYKGLTRLNGTIPDDKITGFTILENVTEVITGGVKTYRSGKNTFTEQEVMTFGGINPSNLSVGYSPMQAARRWTRIEDYMSDMQAANFRNGAVPSGMFTIIANSETEFLDMKRMLQATTRGAKNSNNVLYNYQQVDADGKPGEAQLKWVPFNVTNKDLALKDLHEIVNKKQNDAFGVSGVIKGDVDETTYASAMVVEKFFVKYTLKPVVSAIWRRYSHELARVTGGFGYSIGFDLEIPVLGDELIQRSQAKKTDAETITMLNKEYTLDSIVDAFEYPESYKKLVPISAANNTKANPSVTDDPTVVDDGEANTLDQEDSKKKLANKAVTDEDRRSYEDILRDDLTLYTDQDINTVVDYFIQNGRVPEAEGDLDEKLEAILYAAIIGILIQQGKREQAAALSAALRSGIATPGIPSYIASDYMLNSYRDYFKDVAKGYNQQTREQVRKEIEKALVNGTRREDLKSALQKVGLSEYRARRLADSEINRASNNAALDAYKKVGDSLKDHYFVKVWVADGARPCPTCIALDGTETQVDAAFVSHGQHFDDANGDDIVNTFVDMQTADAHPNCHCHLRFELRRY